MSQELTSQQKRGVRRLVERDVLSEDQAAAVLAELDGVGESRSRGTQVLWEILGYVGGALVLGGASLLLQMSWQDLTLLTKVLLFVAATVVLAGSGVLIGGGPRELRSLTSASTPRARVVAVLFGLASGTAAMAVGSGIDRYETLASTFAGLIVALLGYLVLPSVPGLLVSGGFSAGLVAAIVDEWFADSVGAMTGGLLVLGGLWAVPAGLGLLVRRGVGFGMGAVIALFGAQYPLSSESPAWGYVLTLILALVCFAVFIAQRTTVLLVAGVVGVTLAVPEAAWDWTGGALSAPLIVLIVGIVLLATGGLGLRLHRSVRPAAEPESAAGSRP